MLLVDLETLYTGVSIAFYAGMLIPIMVEQQKRDPIYYYLSDNEMASNALFAMMVFGVGEIVGASSAGLLIDRVGPRLTAFFIISVLSATILVTLINLKSSEFGYKSYLMTGAWGL